MILPLALLLCFMVGCQDKEAMAELEAMKAQAEVEEQNKELLLHLFDELDKKNFDIIDELYASDFKKYSPGVADPINREQNKEMIQAFYAAFPDLTHTIDRLVIGGDMIAGQYTFRGAHKGEFAGIPPTESRVVVTVMGIWRFADGKLVEYWSNIDTLGMMMQLGMELKPKEGKK